MTAGRFEDCRPTAERDVVRSAASYRPARKEKVTTWQSQPELVVLHAVRLAGFSDTEAIADRAGLPESVVLQTLLTCERQREVERFTFADSGGWILTETGKTRDAELLREELEASGMRPVLETTSENFEIVNPGLVRVVTQWQLQSATDGTDVGDEVVKELTDMAKTLGELLAELVEVLPRFSRYPLQFSMALQKARAGEHQWIAGVGRLSCHIVWAELHEDLLSSLGRDRSSDLPERKGGDA